MGIDYENIHKYNCNQYDNFIPIMFFNKKEEKANDLIIEKKLPERKHLQLNLIVDKFDFIYSKAKNLSIKVEQKN